MRKFNETLLVLGLIGIIFLITVVYSLFIELEKLQVIKEIAQIILSSLFTHLINDKSD